MNTPPQPNDPSAASRRRELRVAWLVLALAAALRLSWLDHIEFKTDEAAACWMSCGLAQGKLFPTVGLTSGVGVRNPPAFVYLMALPSLAASDPRWLTAFVALLNVAAVWLCWRLARSFFGARSGWLAALLFAASPWAVVYSRKVWAQDALPLLCTALLFGLLQLVVRGRREWTFAVVFLALLAPQIHFSGLCALLLTAALLVVYRPRLSWRGAGAGVLAAALVAGPYVWAQWRSGFEDVHGALRVTRGGSARRPRMKRTLDAARHLCDISGMGDLRHLLGEQTTEFDRAWPARRGGHWLWLGLLAAGVVTTMRGLDRARTIVLLWLIAPVVVYGLTGLRSWPHYLIVAYPAPFIVMGWVSELWPRGRARVAAAALACVAAVLGAGTMLSLHGFVAAHGGAAGDYGAAFKHKSAAARYVVAHSERNNIHVRHLPARKPRLRFDYRYLLWLHRAAAPRQLVRPAEFIIVERYRDRLPRKDAERLAHAPCRDFGPVRVYELPLRAPK